MCSGLSFHLAEQRWAEIQASMRAEAELIDEVNDVMKDVRDDLAVVQDIHRLAEPPEDTETKRPRERAYAIRR